MESFLSIEVGEDRNMAKKEFLEDGVDEEEVDDRTSGIESASDKVGNF